jgi:glycosyltransferase involved in cell wall biosynthesis
LKDRFPNTVFEFVGDGPSKEDYEELASKLGIADRCRFVGRMPHDEVLRRVGSSFVAVVPSRSECFGLVNIEALAMGTPVVASDVGGISEIFNDGDEGYLVPPDDPDTLANRLAAIMGDPALRDRMSQKALQRFQLFEQQHLIGDQVDWFESLTGNVSQKHDASDPSQAVTVV